MKYRVVPEIIDIETVNEEFTIPFIHYSGKWDENCEYAGKKEAYLSKHIVKANQPFIVRDGRPSMAIHSDSLEGYFEKFDSVEDRLLIEYRELGDKLGKLNTALNKEGFKDKVGETQYNLMCSQDKAMTEYWNILKERLDDLKIKVEEKNVKDKEN